MANAIKLLQQLGFSEYEARAYAALLQHGPLNGYELAKVSGLPRANIYGVLQKLEERGTVIRIESSNSTRYTPVPPEELTRGLSHHFNNTLDTLQQSLEELTPPPERDYIWNMQGYPGLIEHAQTFVEAVRQHLLIALWPPEAKALAGRLAEAEARGVEITTLCLATCPEECGGCRGRVYRYRVPPETRTRWLLLVLDGLEVLAGEIDSETEALAVHTRQRLLVDLTDWYIRHSIALAAALSDIGGQLEPLLSAETKAILDAVGPAGVPGGWLAHMRRLLHRPPQNSGPRSPS